MSSLKSKKILIGVQAICDYLQISEPTFYKFIKVGLPANVIDGRWYAHADNLADFFQKITFVSLKKVPEDAK